MRKRKSLVQQRLDYLLGQRDDLWQQLCNKDMEIDVQQALKVSMEDGGELQPFLRQSLQQSKYKNKPKMAVEQINKFLKSVYHEECHNKLYKELKPLIRDGRLCDVNVNWVIFELSGARTTRMQNQGVYQTLLAQVERYPSELFEPIFLDVKRTIASTVPNKHAQEKCIEDILVAYAIRNPIIGYCQGQNFIVHFIVNALKFDQEDAFWIYAQLLEQIMPLDYYTNIVSALVDQKILEYYIQQYLPDLYHHFQDLQLSIDYFSVQWYLCIFTNQVSPELTKFVLLMLLLDGIMALTICSLILLMTLEKELLKFKQFSITSNNQLRQSTTSNDMQRSSAISKSSDISTIISQSERRPSCTLENPFEVHSCVYYYTNSSK